MTKKKWFTPEELAVHEDMSVAEVYALIQRADIMAIKRDGKPKVDLNSFQSCLSKEKTLKGYLLTNEGFSQVQMQHTELQHAALDAGLPLARDRSKGGLFAKALMKDMIEVLPLLPDTDSFDDVRLYLRSNISYNAIKTRERFASYILKHAFPSGKLDWGLRNFAKKFAHSVALKDVCLYRFMQSQPLMKAFILDVLLPALGQGNIPKSRVSQYLLGKFPDGNRKSIQSTSSAICEVLVSSGLAQVDKASIRFGLRSVPLEAFAFILHSEFSDPGMHHIEMVEQSSLFRAMLWNPGKITEALYELRNKGIITKISDIDGLRQFTTKFSLEEVVDSLDGAGVLR